MSISRAVLDQVMRRLRPLQIKVANLVARAVLTGLNDGTGIQAAQVSVLAGETLDDVERFTTYGVISVPRPGAEGVMLFVDGDRGHPLLIAVDDRSARPTGGDPGDTGLYHFDGAVIRLDSSGDITISCKPGGSVFIDDGSGPTQKLAFLSSLSALERYINQQFDVLLGHFHPIVGGPPTTVVPNTGSPTVPAPSSLGTSVGESK